MSAYMHPFFQQLLKDKRCAFTVTLQGGQTLRCTKAFPLALADGPRTPLGFFEPQSVVLTLEFDMPQCSVESQLASPANGGWHIGGFSESASHRPACHGSISMRKDDARCKACKFNSECFAQCFGIHIVTIPTNLAKQPKQEPEPKKTMCDEIENEPLSPVEAALIYTLPQEEYAKHPNRDEASEIINRDANASYTAAHILAAEVKRLNAEADVERSEHEILREKVRTYQEEIERLRHQCEGMRKATEEVAASRRVVEASQDMVRAGVVPESIAKMNFVLQYGVNCPSKFLVRIGRPDAASMDLKDYTVRPDKGGTLDIIAFGKTFAEAGENAMRQYEEALNRMRDTRDMAIRNENTLAKGDSK